MVQTLRWLVLDLNGFFAAVEQQERPELRGRPVAVAPVAAELSSVIAASTEAKRYGVKCGVPIDLARRICPGLVIVEGRHAPYNLYFDKIKTTLENVMELANAPSTDEFHFRLLGDERQPARAREIAGALKHALREEVGMSFTASVGIAPNRFLAKVGSDMQKPDGLVLLSPGELPEALDIVEDLTDLVGINRRMKLRLNAHKIFTVADLTRCTKEDLWRVWGGRVGADWWHWLRGYELNERPEVTRTLGHSHVLPPEFRNRAGVRAVTLRLLGKASSRMRKAGLKARGLEVAVKGRKSWERGQRIPATHEDGEFVPIVGAWLDEADYSGPTATSIRFWDLCSPEAVTPPLFEREAEARTIPGATLDSVNDRWGKHAVYLGAIHASRTTGAEKIAFKKIGLFSEGAGDHAESDLRARLFPAEPESPVTREEWMR